MHVGRPVLRKASMHAQNFRGNWTLCKTMNSRVFAAQGQGIEWFSTGY